MSLNYKYNKKTKKNCHTNMKPRWNHVEPTFFFLTLEDYIFIHNDTDV